jgi:hypothetical protein
MMEVLARRAQFPTGNRLKLAGASLPWPKEEVIHVCGEKETCSHPEKLKGKPSECSPEQIKECHGDVEEHPCEAGEAQETEK